MPEIIEENRFCLEMDKYLGEQEWRGHKTYWHGTSTRGDSGIDPFVLSKTGSNKSRTPETYFSSHFGYSLAYAFGLEDFHLFRNHKKADDLTGNGKIEVPLDEHDAGVVRQEMLKERRYYWMVLLSVTPDTRLFHAWNNHDLRWLHQIFQNSKNPKMVDFVRSLGWGLDAFLKALKPLRTIDWLDGIPSHFPFTREELLREMRDSEANDGGRLWHGFVNNEKGKYPSIGIFNECLGNRSVVGPLYRIVPVRDGNGCRLSVERCEGSSNASFPPKP